MSPKLALLSLLGVVAAAFAIFWCFEVRRARDPSPAVDEPRRLPRPLHLAIGLATDFFDTLGIGSFATTTTAFRLSGLVDDGRIPGTLNVGHMLPTVAQAFIYVTIVEVDLATLVCLVGASVLGASLGAGMVARLSLRAVRGFMSAALFCAAGIMSASALGLLPKGGDAIGLTGPALAAGAVGNFVLGALMTAGIGLYAPCMVLVSLLGMGPAVAFPIMMASCAFLMPAAGVRFVRLGAYDLPAALGLTLAGVPGVLGAAFVVRSLSLDVLRWLVVAVVLYAAATLLRAFARSPGESGAAPGSG